MCIIQQVMLDIHTLGHSINSLIAKVLDEGRIHATHVLDESSWAYVKSVQITNKSSASMKSMSLHSQWQSIVFLATSKYDAKRIRKLVIFLKRWVPDMGKKTWTWGLTKCLMMLPAGYRANLPHCHENHRQEIFLVLFTEAAASGVFLKPWEPRLSIFVYCFTNATLFFDEYNNTIQAAKGYDSLLNFPKQ